MYLACLKVAQHTSNKCKVNFLRFHDPKYGSSVYEVEKAKMIYTHKVQYIVHATHIAIICAVRHTRPTPDRSTVAKKVPKIFFYKFST